MKRTFLTFFGIAIALVTLANKSKFEEAMGKNIPAMFSASSPQELQVVINQLSRIGAAETNRWEPYYYAAFGYLRMSNMYSSLVDKDKYFELGLKEIEKGLLIDDTNSELVALQGYFIMMQLSADPANRGMTHSGLAFQAFSKAIKLNPQNPRAHFLMGRMQHGTAQFMGGTFDDACVSLNTANQLFEMSAKSENPFAPNWGKDDTLASLKQICDGN